jgi:hypothetical protein
MEDKDVNVELEVREPVEPRQGKLALAAFVHNPIGSRELYSDDSLLTSLTSGGNEPDKMQLPEDFHKRTQLVRYFYERDPIANTVVDKLVELGITSLVLDRNECSDEEYAIYEHAVEVFEKYLKDAAVEYLLSGLVLPRVEWGSVAPDEVDGEVKQRRYTVPTSSWILNPIDIELIQVPMMDEVLVMLTLPDNVRKFLKSGRVGPIEYRAALERFVSQYPEVARAGVDGQGKVLLENQYLIRRKVTTYDVYPTPFLLAATESMMFKRNLKKMDYSIASRVVSAIQLIRLGSDEFPLGEDDVDQLDDLKQEMLWRNKSKNIDRVFQLFANHTVQIDWVYPDTEAMLDYNKYEAVNQDIFFAMGVPRILVSGETLRSATSQAEYAMFSPAATINQFREHLLEWVRLLVREMKERNNFENMVEVRFEQLRLFDLDKLTNLVTMLYDRNALSLTSLAGSVGYEFEDEVEMKALERDLMKEFGIPEFPAMPFSPSPGQVGQPDQNNEDNQ